MYKKKRKLTKEEEKEMLIRYQNEKESEKQKILVEIIEHNIEFATKIAKEYLGNGLEMEDLLQVAVVGIMKAAAVFDVSRDKNFSTVAYMHIRKELIKTVENEGKLMKLPSYIINILIRVNEAKYKIRKETGREATIQELSKILDIDKDKLKWILKVTNDFESLEALKQKDKQILEIQAQNGDIILDEYLLRTEFIDILKHELKYLSVGERKIISLKYGVTDSIYRSTIEVAQILGVSRSYVSQAERVAIKKLKIRLKGISKEYFC